MESFQFKNNHILDSMSPLQLTIFLHHIEFAVDNDLNEYNNH